jgi:hypothetical protein
MSLNDIGNRLGSELSLAESYTVISFFSIALYNVLELTFTLFLSFRRRGGLYFWSFFIATWGIALYSIGFILKDSNLANSISYFYVRSCSSAGPRWSLASQWSYTLVFI